MRGRLSIFAVIVLYFMASASWAGVRINEVMASNGVTLTDEDGDYEDWIELVNISGGPIDLEGYGLSDNYDETKLLHYWSFNDERVAPTFTVGDGELRIFSGAETTISYGEGQGFVGENARFDDDAGHHLRVNNPLGASLTFHAPTTGYEDILFMYETRRSGRGAGVQHVYYTLDGEVYLPYDTFIVDDDAPVTQALHFWRIEGTGNNPDFAVRIRFEEGLGGTAGNNRFDNVTVESAPDVVNYPPQVIGEIKLQRLIEGGDTLSIPLDEVFEDPDGDPLHYEVMLSRDGIVSASIVDDTLELAPLSRGGVEIELYAADERHPPVSVSFRALVYPDAHPLAADAFLFEAWSPDAPEDAYPEHMLFLQGAVDDPAQDASLDHAYYIPHDDYHENDLGTRGFPYNNTRRTRINGLGEDGLSFINTGRGRDLGGALLALDTRGVDVDDDVALFWLCGTAQRNERDYAIRLQYRIGHEGAFHEFPGSEAAEYEYLAQADGHTRLFGPLPLPEAMRNEPYVQLLWRYYHVSGDSGPRPELRLDDIYVGAAASPDVVWGEVLDADGAPAAGVEVLAGVRRAVTDAEGAFYLTGLEDGDLLFQLRGDAGEGRIWLSREDRDMPIILNYPVLTTVVLLHDNDLHFNFNHRDAFEEQVNAFRREYTNTFMLSAGDMFVRQASRWAKPNDVLYYRERCDFMIDAMNAVGYDVCTLGNHELFYIEGHTRAALERANFPLLGANIDIDTDKLPPLEPYIVFETDNKMTLAVLGLATINERDGVYERDAYETAREYDYLRERHHLFVALNHIGLTEDRKLAEAMPELDVIISGHEHGVLEQGKMVNGVLIGLAGDVPPNHQEDENWPKYLGKIKVRFENDRVVEKTARVIMFGELPEGEGEPPIEGEGEETGDGEGEGEGEGEDEGEREGEGEPPIEGEGEQADEGEGDDEGEREGEGEGEGEEEHSCRGCGVGSNNKSLVEQLNHLLGNWLLMSLALLMLFVAGRYP